MSGTDPGCPGTAKRARPSGLLADAERRVLEHRSRRADLRGATIARVDLAQLEALATAGLAEAREPGSAMILVTGSADLLVTDGHASGVATLGDDGACFRCRALTRAEQLAVLDRHANGRLLVDVDE